MVMSPLGGALATIPVNTPTMFPHSLPLFCAAVLLFHQVTSITSSPDSSALICADEVYLTCTHVQLFSVVLHSHRPQEGERLALVPSPPFVIIDTDRLLSSVAHWSLQRRSGGKRGKGGKCLLLQA